jgi:uncharacterized protein GlcG (DUF336 family)
VRPVPTTLFGIAAVTAAVMIATFAVVPSSATPAADRATSSTPIVVHHDVLSLAAAQQLATAAQADCANRGFPVTVAVVDPDGVDILVQRADGTTGATVAVARGKARAAAGFQSPTAGLQEQAKSNPGFTSLPDFVILPGGEPIRSGQALVGGVGVSGAPSGAIDDLCAAAGLKAIA